MADLNVALILRLVDRATAPARAALRQVERAGAGMQRFGAAQVALSRSQIAAAQDRTRALGGEAMALAATGYGMVKMLQPAIRFEKKMAEVGKVVDFEAENGLTRLGQDVQALVTSGGLPMAADGIADIVAAAAQANLIDAALPDEEKRQQLVAFGEAAAKMGVAFDIGAAQAGEAMATWRTQLGLNQSEALLLGDAVNHLSNKMNASAGAVTDVIARSGALAKVAGLSTTEIAALSAAFVQAAPSPEIAATALKSFTGTLVSGETMTARQAEVMDRLGISATDLAKRMRTDAQGAIVDVMASLAQLPEYEQSSALSQLFGEESIGAIAPLLSNLDELKRVFGLVADQANYAGAMTAEYEGVAATTASKLVVLRNYANRLAVTIGIPLLGSINRLVDVIGPLIDRFTEWSEAHPELVRQMALAAAGLLALRAALLVGRFALETVKMALWALNGAVGALIWALGGAVRMVAWFGRGLLFMGRIAGGAVLVGLRGLAGAIRLVGSALLWAGRMALANPLMLVITGIALAAWAIYENWSGFVAYFTEKVDRVRAAFDEGLLNGVLKLLSEFNPFRMMFDGAVALARFVLEKLSAAFDLNLFDKGVAMIASLKDGIWSMLVGMVDAIKAKLSSIVPDWMIDAYKWAKGSDAPAAAGAAPGATPPGRALGGPVRAGQIYRWMEEGAEMFSPRVDGSVVSTRELRALRAPGAGGRGGGSSLSIGDIVIHAATGQSPDEIARAVRRELERVLRESSALHDGGAYAG